MLEILRPKDGELRKLDKPEKGCWINVIQPSKGDLEELNSIIQIPEEIFTSLRDVDEVSTIERHPGFMFVIVRTAHRLYKKEDEEYLTIPLGIVVSDNYMITICFDENEAVDRLKKMKFSISGNQPILRLILSTAKIYLNYLRNINKEIYYIQKDLEKSMKNEELIRLLALQKALVYFSTSLKSNEVLVYKLSRRLDLEKLPDDKRTVEEISEEIQQAIEMAKIYSNILSRMIDTFTSIISNNLTVVMKFLTSVTIMLMIPTLVASIYGMNVDLPFQNSANAFVITLGISIILVIIGVVIFWRRELF